MDLTHIRRHWSQALSVYIWYWQPRPPAFSPPRPVLTATLHKTLIYCFIPVQTSGRHFYLYTLPVPLEKRKWVISLIIFCLTPHYHQFRVSILILPFEEDRRAWRKILNNFNDLTKHNVKMTKPSSSVTLTHHEIKIFKIISKSFILPQLVMKAGYENISVKTQFLFPAISTTKSPIMHSHCH